MAKIQGLGYAEKAQKTGAWKYRIKTNTGPRKYIVLLNLGLGNTNCIQIQVLENTENAKVRRRKYIIHQNIGPDKI